MIHEEIRGEREEMMKRGGRVKCWSHEPVEQSCWPELISRLNEIRKNLFLKQKACKDGCGEEWAGLGLHKLG